MRSNIHFYILALSIILCSCGSSRRVIPNEGILKDYQAYKSEGADAAKITAYGATLGGGMFTSIGYLDSSNVNIETIVEGNLSIEEIRSLNANIASALIGLEGETGDTINETYTLFIEQIAREPDLTSFINSELQNNRISQYVFTQKKELKIVTGTARYLDYSLGVDRIRELDLNRSDSTTVSGRIGANSRNKFQINLKGSTMVGYKESIACWDVESIANKNPQIGVLIANSSQNKKNCKLIGNLTHIYPKRQLSKSNSFQEVPSNSWLESNVKKWSPWVSILLLGGGALYKFKSDNKYEDYQVINNPTSIKDLRDARSFDGTSKGLLLSGSIIGGVAIIINLSR